MDKDETLGVCPFPHVKCQRQVVGKKNGVNLHYVLDYALWAEFACRGPIVTKAEKGLSGL